MIEKVVGNHVQNIKKLMAQSPEKAEDLKDELAVA